MDGWIQYDTHGRLSPFSSMFNTLTHLTHTTIKTSRLAPDQGSIPTYIHGPLPVKGMSASLPDPPFLSPTLNPSANLNLNVNMNRVNP